MVRIEKYTSSGYARLAMEVTETGYSIENNDSPVEYNLWLERGSTWVFDLNNESWAEAYINDQTVIGKYVSFDLRNTDRVLLGSGTITIPHNEDGSKTITFSARILNVADQGDINWFSGTLELTNIPRASDIGTVSATELGQPVSISIDKKVNEFRHQVWWQVNDSGWIDLGKGHDTNVQFTIPVDYASRITDSDTGSLDVCVRTFNDSNQIGKDEYKRGLNIKVPTSIVPTLNTVKIVERNAKIAESIPAENYIKDKSIIRVTAEGASGIYGSKIVSTEISVDNLVVRSITGDFPANKAGTLNVTAKVTDSRGRIATKSTTVKVLDYYSPRIIAFLANRTGNGTNKKIMANVIANVSPLVINGINRNPYTLKIQYSAKKDNRWIDAVSLTNESTERINRQIDCGSFYELSKAYNVRLVIQDKLSDLVDSVLVVRSSRVLWAWGDNRAAIGGFPELEGHFESFLPVAFHSSLNVEDGLMSRGKPIQEFNLTSRDGKSNKFTGDLNNLKTAGGYYAYRVTNSPQGTDNTGYIHVITQDNNNNCVQMYVPANKDAMYMRRSYANSWSGWNAVAGQVDIWHNAIYQNNWKTAGDGVVQYTKTADGTVYLRGVATGGSIADNAAIINLPIGYRPSKYLYKKALNNSYQIAIVGIDTNGNVTVKSNVDKNWLCLDDISFKV
ncbi:DUF859 family phage minor structural protein [uncultured Granulicatella sp.]|jgi:hypothetical protein|uniref:DUF859 family phage minor structural protein n=1 Tax=uncultured Granulicatella sp. TaxID=316089 RepID=UPI00260DA834|nr:DUF859 family phage minor structural protein [uncultured Granulicatella sp.]